VGVEVGLGVGARLGMGVGAGFSPANAPRLTALPMLLMLGLVDVGLLKLGRTKPPVLHPETLSLRDRLFSLFCRGVRNPALNSACSRAQKINPLLINEPLL
jgi:hypothetical protein